MSGAWQAKPLILSSPPEDMKALLLLRKTRKFLQGGIAVSRGLKPNVNKFFHGAANLGANLGRRHLF